MEEEEETLNFLAAVRLDEFDSQKTMCPTVKVLFAPADSNQD